MKKSSKKFEFTPSILNQNFHYSGIVDTEYDSYGPPDGVCDCDIEASYCCRCQVYEGLRVKNVSIEELVNAICNNIDDKILRYCVDRILRFYKVYDNTCWEIDHPHSYYGEEIDSVKLINPQIIIDTLNTMHSLADNISKINYVLELEYQYLLPVLAKCTKIEIVSTSAKNVIFGNDTYGRKIASSELGIYLDWKGISAICMKLDNDKYKIIDGYHRICSLRKNTRNIDIIVYS